MDPSQAETDEFANTGPLAAFFLTPPPAISPGRLFPKMNGLRYTRPGQPRAQPAKRASQRRQAITFESAEVAARALK
jgi:hypothetical protein